MIKLLNLLITWLHSSVIEWINLMYVSINKSKIMLNITRNETSLKWTQVTPLSTIWACASHFIKCTESESLSISASAAALQSNECHRDAADDTHALSASKVVSTLVFALCARCTQNTKPAEKLSRFISTAALAYDLDGVWLDFTDTHSDTECLYMRRVCSRAEHCRSHALDNLVFNVSKMSRDIFTELKSTTSLCRGFLQHTWHSNFLGHCELSLVC